MRKPDAPQYYSHVRRDILHLLPEVCDRMLEVGLGTGATMREIRNLKAVSFSAGIELSPDIAEIARENADQVLDGDIENMELPEHWVDFDVILCLDVLEHLIDPWRVVHVLHERLRPGGVIIASIPNVNFAKAIFPLLFSGRWDLQNSGVLDRTHLRFFTRVGIVELMTCSGLELDLIQAGGMPAGSKRLRANRATFRMIERFLAPQYYVRAVARQA